jgi:phage shock protein A
MSDNTTDLVPFILRDLQAGQADLRQQVADLHTGQTDLRQQVADLHTGQAELHANLSALREEVRNGFAEFRAEIRREMREQHADLVALFSGAYRDHERRISDLETAVDRLETPRPRRRKR